jgi:hypothetical protein
MFHNQTMSSSDQEDGVPLLNNRVKTKRLGSIFRFHNKCMSKNNNTEESVTSDDTPAKEQREVVIPLLPLEEKCYALNGSPISSLTWFEGDHDQACATLRQSTRAIVRANPWLLGHVVKRKGKVFLIHHESQSEDFDCDKDGCKEHPRMVPNLPHIVDPRDSPLHRGIAIDDTADMCRPYLVQNGPSQFLWKVTIVPCSVAPRQFFAVVHSMSHVVSDGHTYYNIHNMLFANSEIRPLNARRIFETVQLQKEGLGHKEYGLFDSPGFLTGIICGVVKSALLAPMRMAPKIKKRYFIVDNDKLEQAKKEAMASNHNDSGVAFVSTNDVITSWFFRQSQCSYGLMALNFRNRLEEHHDNLAGNYENSVLYYAQDFATPTLIRMSLMPKDSWRRQVTFRTTTTPSLWKHLKGHFSLLSNWSSFATNSNLPNCRELLHFPLFARGKHPLPNNLSVGIIFRVGPGKTAMYLVGNSKVMRRLEACQFESVESLQLT